MDEYPTPFVCIDEARMQRNIEEMQAWVEGRGARLRPHFKTHRSGDVARRQLDAGAVGLTCSDLAQLNALVAMDIDDIFLSSPVQLDPASWPALRRAAASKQVTYSVCSPASAVALGRALEAESSAAVWLEIEVGCHRTGVSASKCVDLAVAAIESGLTVTGIFGYPGQGYEPGRAQAASQDERRALGVAAERLKEAGVHIDHISAGSSPTVIFAEPGLVTEYRPGTYVFGDRQQVGLGAIGAERVALTVTSTVIAREDDRIVLDVGGKGLGRDLQPWLAGHGSVLAPDGVPISRLYDHHAIIDSWDGTNLQPGERLSVYPNNVNSTLALQSAVLFRFADDTDACIVELVHDT
jgi:D-serine deaminase-like pyridoxal phosphate-dependent protein